MKWIQQVLARLATDHWRQDKGGLTQGCDAPHAAGPTSPGYALAVHARDEEARPFYEHFDFVSSSTDPIHLFVPLKDVRRTFSQLQRGSADSLN
jgi:hypothetical protein